MVLVTQVPAVLPMTGPVARRIVGRGGRVMLVRVVLRSVVPGGRLIVGQEVLPMTALAVQPIVALAARVTLALEGHAILGREATAGSALRFADKQPLSV